MEATECQETHAICHTTFLYETTGIQQCRTLNLRRLHLLDGLLKYGCFSIHNCLLVSMYVFIYVVPQIWKFQVGKFSCFNFLFKNIFVVQIKYPQTFLDGNKSAFPGLAIWNETTHAKTSRSTNSLLHLWLPHSCW